MKSSLNTRIFAVCVTLAIAWLLASCATKPNGDISVRYSVPWVEYTQNTEPPVWPTPPPIPVTKSGQSLLQTSQTPSVTLAWDAINEPWVSGYAIRFGGSSGQYTNRVDARTNTTITISPLTPGDTYYFVANAYTSDGQENPPSNEIGYTVPGGGPLRIIHVYAETSTNPQGTWTTVTNWPAIAITNPAGNRFYRVKITP